MIPNAVPENWAIGHVSGVCVDAQDQLFIVSRNEIRDKEAEVTERAPPYIEVDPDGNMVNGFG